MPWTRITRGTTNVFADLGYPDAAGLTRRELSDEVIRPMVKRAPRGGTYLLSRILCAYAHAAEQGRIPDDFVFPTLGIKGAPQVRRKRAFTDAELATFIRWLPRSRYSSTARDALALVLFTGCRHDLRRTAATGLAMLGCPRVVQDHILNHVNGSVSAIYDRHRYDAEARVWLQKWADYLQALTVHDVVPLPAA